MGSKLPLQQEILPATLMLNEPQSGVLWNNQIQNQWQTPYDELSNQFQNFSISSLSVIYICFEINQYYTIDQNIFRMNLLTLNYHLQA